MKTIACVPSEQGGKNYRSENCGPTFQGVISKEGGDAWMV